MKPVARKQNHGFPQYMNQLEPKMFVKSFNPYATLANLSLYKVLPLMHMFISTFQRPATYEPTKCTALEK